MFYTNGYRTKKSQKVNTRLSRKDTKSYGFLTSNPKRIISAVLFKIVPIHKNFPIHYMKLLLFYQHLTIRTQKLPVDLTM